MKKPERWGIEGYIPQQVRKAILNIALIFSLVIAPYKSVIANDFNPNITGGEKISATAADCLISGNGQYTTGFAVNSNTIVSANHLLAKEENGQMIVATNIESITCGYDNALDKQGANPGAQTIDKAQIERVVGYTTLEKDLLIIKLRNNLLPTNYELCSTSPTTTNEHTSIGYGINETGLFGTLYRLTGILLQERVEGIPITIRYTNDMRALVTNQKSIRPGDSGGPLVVNGCVVAINESITNASDGKVLAMTFESGGSPTLKSSETNLKEAVSKLAQSTSTDSSLPGTYTILYNSDGTVKFITPSAPSPYPTATETPTPLEESTPTPLPQIVINSIFLGTMDESQNTKYFSGNEAICEKMGEINCNPTLIFDPQGLQDGYLDFPSTTFSTLGVWGLNVKLFTAKKLNPGDSEHFELTFRNPSGDKQTHYTGWILRKPNTPTVTPTPTETPHPTTTSTPAIVNTATPCPPTQTAMPTAIPTKSTEISSTITSTHTIYLPSISSPGKQPENAGGCRN